LKCLLTESAGSDSFYKMIHHRTKINQQVNKNDDNLLSKNYVILH